MPLRSDDIYRSVRLVGWGLRPGARPAQDPEYAELVDRYRDLSDFRDSVRAAADALDLDVLDVSSHGIVLGPRPESVFSLKPGEFLPGTASADDRLISGLVQVAVAAHLYPRSIDLEETPELERRPVTVAAVDEILRELCGRLAERSRTDPDPAADEELSGLYEAWRVYQARVSVKETADDRRPRTTTRRMIERVLDRLCEFGCFQRQIRGQETLYRPTRRYQVQVQNLAAAAVFRHVRSVLENRPDEPGGASSAASSSIEPIG
jgi:hypothetical protein